MKSSSKLAPGVTRTDEIRMHEIYLSVQGESTFAGRPCVFLRTTGCPLRCTWCDTEYAFHGGEMMPVDAVVERAVAFGVSLVEVTGGEPLAQRASLELMAKLADRELVVLLETSGAQDTAQVDPRVRIILDVKCPDSGMEDRNHWPNLDRLRATDEVKFVLASRRDYEYARDVIRRHRLTERCEVLLSTVFDALDRKAVVEWLLEDRLDVRFQLQMHKFVWPPDEKGV